MDFCTACSDAACMHARRTGVQGRPVIDGVRTREQSAAEAPRTRPEVSGRSPAVSIAEIVALQRSAGNSATNALLRDKLDPPFVRSGDELTRPDPEPNPNPPARHLLTVLLWVETTALRQTEHSCGHAWVRLEDPEGHVWTYGYWPTGGGVRRIGLGGLDEEYNGSVHHPDEAHADEVTHEYPFVCEPADFLQALNFCAAWARNPGRYRARTRNCTTFAMLVARIAGLYLPDDPGLMGPYTLLVGEGYSPAGLAEAIEEQEERSPRDRSNLRF